MEYIIKGGIHIEDSRNKEPEVHIRASEGAIRHKKGRTVKKADQRSAFFL
jgi:hypothetical protein